MIDTLHYITESYGGWNHAEHAQAALDSGVRWVQYRNKTKDFSYADQAKLVVEACRKKGAICIINDDVELARRIGADGVHLGADDMAPQEARKVLGESAIIGGTANQFVDLEYLMEQEVDYIGLGPLRYTPTKTNLRPTLGFEGYSSLLEKMKQKQWEIPVVAIGGVGVQDIEDLRNTGVHGIAVASLINRSKEKRNTVTEIYRKLS